MNVEDGEKNCATTRIYHKGLDQTDMGGNGWFDMDAMGGVGGVGVANMADMELETNSRHENSLKITHRYHSMLIYTLSISNGIGESNMISEVFQQLTIPIYGVMGFKAKLLEYTKQNTDNRNIRNKRTANNRNSRNKRIPARTAPHLTKFVIETNCISTLLKSQQLMP